MSTKIMERFYYYETILRGVLSNYREKWGLYTEKAADICIKLGVDRAVDYTVTVYNDYFKYGNLKVEDFKDKVVLELGPGDNLGVAIRFLCSGVAKFYCIEKFPGTPLSDYNIKVYLALRERLSPEEQKEFDNIVDVELKRFNPDRLIYIYGKGAEEAKSLFSKGFFDFIISRGVLQDIVDLEYIFDVMDWLLKPGGMLLHKVELRDYAVFNTRKIHPLSFLTVPDWLWDMMTSELPRPNRRRVNSYRENLDRLGYEYKLYITHIIGKDKEFDSLKEHLIEGEDYSSKELELVNEIRERLLPRYRALPTEDLLISGIFIVAKKPLSNT